MPQPRHTGASPSWYKSPLPWLTTVAVSLSTFAVGWHMEPTVTPPQALRASGYQFIEPLLVDNVNDSRVFPENRSLSANIRSVIDAHIRSGDISKASAYFVDLKNDAWSDVYPDERFYPSSMGKIPLMIAYYQMAEHDSHILDEKLPYNGGPDLNQRQDIKPAEAIVAGRTYTVEQLIEYMVKDSDNNATALLYNGVDHSALDTLYAELNIPTTPIVVNESDLDSVNPEQISELFRILYNATYISRDYSEKALQLMSDSSFTPLRM